MWHFLDDALLAAKARLVAVAAQRPEVDPSDRLCGERLGRLRLGMRLGVVVVVDSPTVGGGDAGPLLRLMVDMA